MYTRRHVVTAHTTLSLSSLHGCASSLCAAFMHRCAWSLSTHAKSKLSASIAIGNSICAATLLSYYRCFTSSTILIFFSLLCIIHQPSATPCFVALLCTIHARTLLSAVRFLPVALTSSRRALVFTTVHHLSSMCAASVPGFFSLRTVHFASGPN